MSFIELAKKRFSSRTFKNQPVDDKKLLQVLEAARIAPSAANRQPWVFYIVKQKENRKRISSCYSKPWLLEAPAIIVACGDHTKSWVRDDGKDHCDIDVAIAVDHITLAATELGLSTCWICKFDTRKCMKLLNLPAHVEPVVLLPIGYPSEKVDMNRHSSRRKQISEIVQWETY